MITQLLLGGRTLAYRIASPAESAWRRAAGHEPLPPLWLRRHTGPVARFESAARETAEFLDRLGLARPGDTVVDIGCGDWQFSKHINLGNAKYHFFFNDTAVTEIYPL